MKKAEPNQLICPKLTADLGIFNINRGKLLIVLSLQFSAVWWELTEFHSKGLQAPGFISRGAKNQKEGPHF